MTAALRKGSFDPLEAAQSILDALCSRRDVADEKTVLDAAKAAGGLIGALLHLPEYRKRDAVVVEFAPYLRRREAVR